MDNHEAEYATARIEARQNWDRARQAAFWEALIGLLPARSTDLLSFEQVKNRLRLAQKTYHGVQDIPLVRIVGSVGRYRDFTRSFLPRNSEMQERWERVSKIASTKGMPPIEVYQVGEAYFVLDGNHRVSVARQMGMNHIDAHVWEFQTPVGLSGEADLNELLIKAEYAQFLEKTHLDQRRSEAQIMFTAPGRYRELEWQIELYRRALEQIDEQPVSYEQAVEAWYDMIYTPALQIIREQGVMERFPNRTEADLFIWSWKYSQELYPRQGSARLAQAAGQIAQTPHWGILGKVWRSLTSLFRRRAA